MIIIRLDFAYAFRREKKMFGKKEFAFSVVVIYLVLIYFLFAYEKQPINENKSVCSYRGACVRFCCDNFYTCGKDFVDKYFNLSLIPEDDGNAYEVEYLFGQPDCSTLNPLLTEKQWKFTSVRLRNLVLCFVF